jgi:hypothetical protein
LPTCLFVPRGGPLGLVDRPASSLSTHPHHRSHRPPKRTTKTKKPTTKNPPPLAGDRTGRFSGVADCFLKTAREEGLGAFYKGFIPNFARLGSWNVVMFLTLEQVKKLFQPAAGAADK